MAKPYKLDSLGEACAPVALSATGQEQIGKVNSRGGPINCVNCGTGNESGSKFCRECGAPLSLSCPSCSQPVEAADKFCANCGHALKDQPPAQATATTADDSAEKRFVSVLFADIVAYTTFSEGRDPDEIRDLLTVYFDRARAIIEKFGGVVDKFIGDAVMGVWGAETVREDDAERAVRAALELVSMVADLGVEQGHEGLRLRAGVNSGTTSVGPGGNEKGLVVGDIVNTASRLQAAAEPGTVFVGEATHHVTAGSIAYEDRGQLEVKGKADLVEAWRALRSTGRMGATADARELPFTGRDREMRLLKDMLDAAAGEQRARLVSVTGEAGIGKSRLAQEFMNHVDGFSEVVYWHRGRSPSYGEGLPMWAVGEMIRQRAGIIEDEEPTRARTRLRTTIAQFVPSEEDRQWIDGWLSGLLGLAEMPAGSGSELHSAIRSFFQHVATEGTTVMVFEDLHWADASLVEFISELVDRSTRSPILVVTLARPELLERYATFGSQQRSSMSLGLAPLSRDAMETLLTEHLPGVDTGIVTRIVERASGFPLYVAEIVRMLTNGGSLTETDGRWAYHGEPDDMAIPETLQAVIGARLDRLDTDLRSVLQEAAVLGLTFTKASLEHVSGRSPEEIDQALRRFVQLELLDVEDDPRSPERGQYRFVQGVIQEVAYRRLNRTERRIRHLAAAEYFQRSDDPELAGVVSAHYIGAYEASPAGPQRDELSHRALDSLIDAAERSRALHSDVQAMNLYEQAIALSADPAEQASWYLEAAKCGRAEGAFERSLGYLDNAQEIYEGRDDIQGIRRVASARSDSYNSSFSSDLALAAIEPAYLALDEIVDEVSLGVAAEAVRSYSLTEHLDEAITAADRALPVAEALEMTSITVELIISRSTALAFAGRITEAVSGLTGVAEICEQQGLLAPAIRALNNLTTIVWGQNPAAAQKHLNAFTGLVERVGASDWISRAYWFQAVMAVGRADWDAITDWLDKAAEFQSDPLAISLADNTRALGQAMQGREGGLERWHATLEAFGDLTDPQSYASVASQRSGYYELSGDLEQSYRWAVEAESLPDAIRRAIRCAAWLEDADRLTTVAALVEQSLAGAIRNNSRALIEAIKAAQAGDKAEAATQFVDLLARMEGVEDLLEIVGVQATFARVVGSDHPAAAQAAELAATLLTETGSMGLYLAWQDVLPRIEESRSVG
ncbi:MAG: AAA family ATPase [Acidimicrobiia bacterium]|nr:AAA family ATPase [Acidimicrobiia bacterium]